MLRKAIKRRGLESIFHRLVLKLMIITAIFYVLFTIDRFLVDEFAKTFVTFLVIILLLLGIIFLLQTAFLCILRSWKKRKKKRKKKWNWKKFGIKKKSKRRIKRKKKKKRSRKRRKKSKSSRIIKLRNDIKKFFKGKFKRKRKKRRKKAKKRKKYVIQKQIIVKKIKLKGNETELDVLYKKVKKKGKIKFSDAAKYLGVDKKKIEEWAGILEEHSLIQVHYPAIGEPELKKWK